MRAIPIKSVMNLSEWRMKDSNHAFWLWSSDYYLNFIRRKEIAQPIYSDCRQGFFISSQILKLFTKCTVLRGSTFNDFFVMKDNSLKINEPIQIFNGNQLTMFIWVFYSSSWDWACAAKAYAFIDLTHSCQCLKNPPLCSGLVCTLSARREICTFVNQYLWPRHLHLQHHQFL